jgi:hypothetical protein
MSHVKKFTQKMWKTRMVAMKKSSYSYKNSMSTVVRLSKSFWTLFKTLPSLLVKKRDL